MAMPIATTPAIIAPAVKRGKKRAIT